MTYQCNLPEKFNAADYFVDRNIREGRGDKVAVICEGRKVTYEQIRFGMNQVGNALAGAGIKIEDRVATCRKQGIKAGCALKLLSRGQLPGFPNSITENLKKDAE
jgi:acyl-coenzyme A synthetase/AMP-(fatty) acid ligase